ncbi:Bug family tripartite tricarboxylate transporter substrate binding protein [Variovorax terrae]|uniref:Tripartite tricarboxylate transporter substrate binding protein n=1 Tax=Variovorax terrae TaxID=2923278 RepID=A0A9X1VWQ3_9BURK|nr:tripartite tricarboxylate transporter substrate binding protein [Variovorax terrae]MCJ0765211.1 tripartite tricarboxylate transporter substrate binding protein [Variovorax terrae]
MKRRTFAASLAAALAQTMIRPAMAQESYPTKPIRWIVGFPAGGATDAVVRGLAEGMQPGLGQPLVVDNRPGASGNIAVSALMQSKPDGYTIMNAENSTLLFNPHLYAKLPYDKDKDFTYIGAIGQVPVTLVVNPAFPAKTLAEFLAYAKKYPGKVNFASAGSGSLHRIAMELLQRSAGIQLTHVSYKGGSPAIQDVIGGQVECMMMDLTIGLQNIRAGQVRPLAVTATQRIATIPDVPTFTELGLKNMLAFTLHGLLGPAGMPPAIVDRLNTGLRRAMLDANVQKRFAESGLQPTPGTPEEFKRLVAAESDRWGAVIKAAGIRAD